MPFEPFPGTNLHKHVSDEQFSLASWCRIVVSDPRWSVTNCGPSWSRSCGTDPCRRGRPWNDHRLALEAIYWRFRTGSPWRELPEEFGAWQSVAERHRRWSADGTYERMFAVVKESSGRNHTDVGTLLSVESTTSRLPI